MGKKYGKSTTLSEELYEWLEEYRDQKGLRSVAQAIEFIIREAGYNPSKKLEIVEAVQE